VGKLHQDRNRQTDEKSFFRLAGTLETAIKFESWFVWASPFEVMKVPQGLAAHEVLVSQDFFVEQAAFLAGH